jgi:hypothetical protein
MPDAPDPPRKHYKFKAAEFENVNGVRRDHALHEAQPPADPGIVPTEKIRIDVRDLARAAAIPAANASTLPAPPPNEVHAILRENLDRANAAGLNDVDLTPKPASRRTRDYWIALAIGNSLLAVALMISPIFAGAGLIIFNVGLTWIMWFVMDDY